MENPTIPSSFDPGGHQSGNGAPVPAAVPVAIAGAVVASLLALLLAALAFARSGRAIEESSQAAEAAGAAEAASAATAQAERGTRSLGAAIIEQAQQGGAVVDVAEVYDRVADSFVVVRTTRGGTTDANAARADKGLGSGVVTNLDGDIVTALHVVSGADSVIVAFLDGTESPASILATDPARDLAVLRPETPGGTPVTVGDVRDLAIGDPVFIVGNPLGLTASITGGIVSGLDRSLPLDISTSLEGLIQFDAAVNPGNSGGPLLTRSGQVVGIVTAAAAASDLPFSDGIGFAVPVGFVTDMTGT